MPITDFLPCTHVSDEFESLSPARRRHAKTYATGLVAASNTTVAGIAREVLPANSQRALNKFFTEYDWDEQQLNHERLEELQKHGEMRRSKDGCIILGGMITEKAGDFVPGVGRFYSGQDLIYAFYADDRTVYPFTFRLYEQQDEDEQNHDIKYDLAREIVTELEEEVGGRRHTYLFDSWFAHDSGLPEHIESYGRDWIGPLRSNRQVTYTGEQMRVDALAELIDTVERDIEHDTDHIWTRKLFISKPGDAKLVIAEKGTNEEDEDNPVKYLVTNKIDAPTAHVIHSYGMRWRIETSFEDSKQDLGLGDCEMRTNEGASRHWHLLMAAYSLVRLDPESSVLGTVRSKASSLRANPEYFLKEAVYSFLSLVRDNGDRGVDDLIEEIDHLFAHSIADANVQS